MLEVLQEDDKFHHAGSARIDVLISTIEPRQASQIVKDLSQLLPLDQAKLTHLKRIRSSKHPDNGRLLQVLLSPPEMYHSLDEPKRKDFEERYNLRPVVHAVPKYEPQTRAQFQEGGSAWPMIFHHSTSEEARRAARAIPDQDVVNAVTFMRVAINDSKTARQQNGGRPTVGAVIVDPAVGNGRVVATASRERQMVRNEGPASMRDHPLHHPAMLCVQGVGRAIAARKQRNQGENRGEGEEGGKEETGGNEPPPTGGNRKSERSVMERSGKASLKTGCVVSDGGVEGEEEVVSLEQYLCTGFDLYITQEPGLMCAMALVHSRVRRVIYGVRDTQKGCLGSVMMLHTLTSLNHNYRVFENVCADECRLSLTNDQESTPTVA